MKKIISVVLVVCMLLGTAPLLTSCADDGTVTLNVYNWGEYISDGTDGTPDVLKEFTKRTGIKVNYSFFTSNETLYSKLKTGGVSYDVIIPSDYMIGKLIREDMLEPLNYKNIPNYEYIDEKFKGGELSAYDPECKYSVPYAWGRTGLVYNTKYVTKKQASSWSVLWNKKFKYKTLMFDNNRDSFGIAELLLGKSLNTTNEKDLEQVAELLKKQRELVDPVYVMDQTFDNMASEEAYVAPYYVGDCLTMRDDNPDLAVSVPKEGCNVFVDAMCIPKGSRHKKEAEAFINFMCDTDIAYANIEYIQYTSPQVEAAIMHKEYLTEEYDKETAELIYPDDLTGGEIYSTLDKDTYQLMTNLWIDIRR